MARDGFTLVEVLIALALGALVFLPALGVFSTVLKASGRSAETCRAHLAAETMAQSAAAGIRIGDEVEELRVAQRPMRVVVRTRRGDDPATVTVTAAADLADGGTHKLGIVAFPPLRPDEIAKRESALK